MRKRNIAVQRNVPPTLRFVQPASSSTKPGSLFGEGDDSLSVKQPAKRTRVDDPKDLPVTKGKATEELIKKIEPDGIGNLRTAETVGELNSESSKGVQEARTKTIGNVISSIGQTNKEESREKDSTAEHSKTLRPRVPLFVPPRRSEASDCSSTNATLITGAAEVSHRFAQFRRDVVRTILFGIHCSTFGGSIKETGASLLVVLVHASKSDFDVIHFLEDVSILDTKFILIEEASWSRSSLTDVLQILTRSMQASRVAICAFGNVCRKVLEAVSTLKQREVTVTSLAFIYPSLADSFAKRCKLFGIPVFLETDCVETRFESDLRASGCDLKTCVDAESLQEFIRKTCDVHLGDEFGTYGDFLTQFTPSASSFASSSSSSDEFVQNDHVIETLKCSLDIVVAIHISSRNATLWPSGENIKKEAAAVQVGDVVQTAFSEGGNESISRLVLRKDDPLRAAFVRHVHRQGHLPSQSKLPVNSIGGSTEDRHYLTLEELLEGHVQEGRYNLQVLVTGVDVRVHQLIVTDKSLPNGLTTRLSLQRPFPGIIHRVEDFAVGTTYSIRGIRIEFDSAKSMLRAVLDGFSSKYKSGNVLEGQGLIREQARIVTVKELIEGNIFGEGKMLLTATIADVLFKGYSYAECLSKWSNVMDLTQVFVTKSAGAEFVISDFMLRLRDGSLTLTVLVAGKSAPEVLPFVRAERLMSSNYNARLEEIVLIKRLCHALIAPGNKPCEFALERHDPDGPLCLVTMDI